MSSSTLAENLAQRLNDIHAQIAHIQTKAENEIAALKAKAAVLQAAGALITPQIEAAVGQLQQIGILTQL